MILNKFTITRKFLSESESHRIRKIEFDWHLEPGPDGEHGAVNVVDFPDHVAKLHADSDIGFR